MMRLICLWLFLFPVKVLASGYEFCNQNNTLIGIMTDSGNFGLKTSSPSVKLHVSTGSVMVDGTGAGIEIQVGDLQLSNDRAVLGRGTGGASRQVISGNNVNAVEIGDSAGWSAGLTFLPGATVKMTLTTAGDLGIGIAAPGAKLHLSSGTLLIDGNTASLKVSTANHANAVSVSGWLSATGTINFGALAGATCTDATMTLNGAVDGDDIAVGVPNDLASITGVSVVGFVSAANTVNIRACCITVAACSADAPSVTVRATIWKH